MKHEANSIELPRRITKRVRGLHLALILARRHGNYHGHRIVLESACLAAECGQYGLARGMLRDMRRNGRDRSKEDRDTVLVRSYLKG